MDVLALDFSEVQTRGAERRGKNIQKKLAKSALKEGVDSPTSNVHREADTCIPTPDGDIPSFTTGSLTHQMTAITSQTLDSSVSRWISDTLTPSHATPVLFVALHACGTLTPDILRCFLANQKKTHPSPGRSSQSSWYAAALVVVGCCYNLMSPDSGMFLPHHFIGDCF
jgi:Methyltransferase domain